MGEYGTGMSAEQYLQVLWTGVLIRVGLLVRLDLLIILECQQAVRGAASPQGLARRAG